MAKKDKEIQQETTVEETVETPEVQEETPETVEVPEVNPWEEKYNAERDAHLRVAAEFDNFRKRTIREKMDLIQSGGSDVLKAILPILDDMQRAIAASEKSDDIAALREGERLVVQKFIDTLRQKKVVEIEALDAPFDENLHEAVARFAAGEDKRGKVIDVIERGYMLGDKVLRFAKVVVGE